MNHILKGIHLKTSCSIQKINQSRAWSSLVCLYLGWYRKKITRKGLMSERVIQALEKTLRNLCKCLGHKRATSAGQGLLSQTPFPDNGPQPLRPSASSSSSFERGRHFRHFYFLVDQTQEFHGRVPLSIIINSSLVTHNPRHHYQWYKMVGQQCHSFNVFSRMQWRDPT